MTIGGFIASPAPLNPHLLKLFDRTSDRIALVHNSFNRVRLPKGIRKDKIASWGSHVRWDNYGEEKVCHDDCMSECPPYRFTSVYPEALEWPILVKGLGDKLLSAYEKGDTVEVEALRETQNRQILDLGLDINMAMKFALIKLRYYQGLIDGGLNSGENAYQGSTQGSMASRVTANVSETVSQSM